jgi:hypothetical protein
MPTQNARAAIKSDVLQLGELLLQLFLLEHGVVSSWDSESAQREELRAMSQQDLEELIYSIDLAQTRQKSVCMVVFMGDVYLYSNSLLDMLERD